jgi:voltage-gated potassium channel
MQLIGYNLSIKNEMTSLVGRTEEEESDMKLRMRLQDFFAEHAVGWELFMIALAGIYVGFDAASIFVNFTPVMLDFMRLADIAISVIFALEFVTRLLIATARWTYIETHWLDLVAAFPAVHWLRITRLIYVFRCLRFPRTEGVCNSMDRLEEDIMSFLRLNGLEWILLALTGSMVVSSWLFYYFEHPVNDKIVTYWDALYASLVTWTTPGYGDIFPVTENGRICGLVLIISGLVTWGVLIANLSAFLSNRRKTENIDSPVVLELHDKLLRISELDRLELISFRGSVNALIDSKIEEK